IGVPRLASLILTHELDGEIKGLKEWAPEDRPNALILFWSFRVMVGLGLLMILCGVLGLWLRRGDKVYEARGFQRLMLLMGPSGIVALLAGWVTTEVGRQPWVVYGLLRTSDAVSSHSATQMGVSLTIFVLVYFAVFGVGITYLLRMMRKGPVLGLISAQIAEQGGPGHARTPARPLSASAESVDDEGVDDLSNEEQRP